MRVSAEEEIKGLDKLFAEGKEQEYLLEADLAERLQKAPRPQQKQEAAKIACRFAVAMTGLTHPAIKKSLHALERDDCGNPWLMRELEFFLDKQEDRAWKSQEEMDETSPRELQQYYLEFRQTRATQAVYFALQSKSIQAISEAFSALVEEEKLIQLKRNILTVLPTPEHRI